MIYIGIDILILYIDWLRTGRMRVDSTDLFFCYSIHTRFNATGTWSWSLSSIRWQT